MGVEWYTPGYVIEAARRTMGGIDLDPASCEEANRVVKAERFYTIAQDGLLLPWEGRLWLNPPFGVRDTRAFVGRAVDCFDRGLIDQVCILIPFTPDNRTVTNLFGMAWHCHPREKVMFIRPGSGTGAIQFSTPIFYFGDSSERFADCFSTIGAVCAPVRPYRSQGGMFE